MELQRSKRPGVHTHGALPVMAHTEVEPVGNVVLSILCREKNALSASDLYVLCSRAFAEQRLLGGSVPEPLHSLDTFTAFLRSLRSSGIHLTSHGNDCDVSLAHAPPPPDAPALSGRDSRASQLPHAPFQFTRAGTPDPSEQSGGSSYYHVREFDGEAGPVTAAPGLRAASYALPAERLAQIRSRVCALLLDHVLTETGAFCSSSAVGAEDARQRCMKYLVRPPAFFTLLQRHARRRPATACLPPAHGITAITFF